MLLFRDRLVILFATAPEGFAASRKELRRKYAATPNQLYHTLGYLVRRKILEFDGQLYRAGPVMREELGVSTESAL